MNKTSSIPDAITKYKPCKCVRLREDHGVYRVYKYHAVKLASGEWGADCGYLIGKIIPGKGFIPNKRYMKELEEEGKAFFNDEITDLCYGNYALLLTLTKDVLDRLKCCFPEEKALQIYTYGLILCANGFIHMDQVDEFYQESILSLMYRDYSFRMGYTAIKNLLRDLGMKGNPVQKFEQNLIDSSSKNIAIDGHVIASCSEENDLAEPGYKMRFLKSPQVNLLIAYDTKNSIPLVYRTYRGTSIDKKSCEEFLRYRKFESVKFIVDRGFFSPKLLSAMSENRNTYIIPLPANDKNFKRIKKSLAYTSGEFVYKPSEKETTRVIYYEEKIDGNTRVIFFKDMDENNSKRKSYQQHIALGDATYTQENYEKYCEWWGVYALQTTTTDPAYVVYSDYKGRWSIETYNNYLKNDAAFKDLKEQDYYMVHGLDFIMLITGLMHSRLIEAVKRLDKNNISTIDILIKASHMRMVRHDKIWELHNTRRKDLELLEKMGFTPAKSYTPSSPVKG